MGSGRARKVAALAVVALLLAASAVLVASAAPAPRALRFACAHNLYNAKNVLHFVTRSSDCRGAGKTVVNFANDYPVYTCRKEHGGFAARQRRFQFPSGIRDHGPAGLMRLVDDPSKCAPASQPNETPITLPATVSRLFCAAKQGGELRWAAKVSDCDHKEFPVRLASRSTSGSGGDPVANADSASTDEDHPTTISVLANDKNTASSSSNAGLHVASVDTAGTTGMVTVNAGDTVTYDPSGHFESLKVGQTATDTFKYRAKKGAHTSAPATVTVTITGVNDAPVAVDDSATTDKGHSKVIPVLSNDTDADGDSLSVASVDTTGTQGAVTINGDGTVTYDPNHQFDSLAPNQTAHDTFKYKANDGHADSNAATVDVTVTGLNNAPVVTTTAGSTAYTENAPATMIDPGVTVTDSDNANLASAQVRISAGFQASDALVFVNQNGITGNYDSTTGVLTLTGSATKANYQTALRSVQYINSGDNPSASKTAEFKANDGTADSSPATKSIAVTAVNDAPTLTASSGQASYTEGSAPVQPDPGLSVTDPDSAQLQSATASITTNFTAADGDTLSFTNQNGIVGSYNAATGVLTLTGNATVANYQAALRSVTFSFTSTNPSTATRTVSFQATDTSSAASNTVTRNVGVTATNTAPTVTTSSGSTAYTEGDPSTVIDGAVTATDPDSANLASAQVRISANFESGDTLALVNTPNITSNYNAGTGVLTLTGPHTVANYQAALRSVEYSSGSNDNPALSKTIEFKVNDGSLDSNLATKSLSITRVNDAPTVTTSSGQASYTEGSTAAQPDPGLNVTDPDSAQLQGATVSITSNFSSADGDTLNFSPQNGITGSYNAGTGVLTLSGSSSVANYQTAMRSVTFSFTSTNPSTSTRTVSFQATDTSSAASNVATRDVGVTATNNAPTVTTSSGSTPYTEAAPATTVDASLTVTDPDSPNLASAVVRVSTGFQSGDDLQFANQNGITGNYDAGIGVLTLTGSSSVANYQTALRSVKYASGLNLNPSTPKQIGFVANDGAANSSEAFKSIDITGVNNGPVINTTSSALTYTEGDPATAVDNGVTISDPEGDQISGATVQITGNYSSSEDVLAFSNQNGITGSYNSGSGTMTLSGTTTAANYQTALRSVTYQNTSNNPSTLTRTVSFQGTDNGVPNTAGNVATRDINISAVNNAPTVTTSGGSTAYTEGAAATTVDTGVTVSDVDNANLASAQVRLSAATFEPGDTLGFTDQNGISHSYDAATGILSLTGTATKANYQTALQSVTYSSGSNQNPATSKDVQFKVNDGAADSNTATKNLTITRVNSAPTLTTSGGNASYTEQSTPVQPDPALTLTDPDSTNIQGAVVSITSNFSQADGDTLSFSPQNGITGNYDSTTGVLTLSGTTSVANYETALRSVTFSFTSHNPSTSPRTVSFKATDDSGADSNTATRNVSITAVDDAPVVTTSGGSTAYTENAAAVAVDGSVTVSDVDNANLTSARVQFTNGFDTGDSLNFSPQNGITGTYNSGSGVLTLTGTASVANYQTALQSVTFSSTNNAPTTSKTVEFKVNDGTLDSNLPTKSITVTPVNDAPTLTTTGSSLAYTENDPPTAVDNGLTATDPDSTNASGATVSITGNFNGLQDLLALPAPVGNITGSYDSGTGVLTLSGTDTIANYQAALRSVTYQNTSDAPTPTASPSRTISFQLTDSDGPAASNAATRGIAITAVNDPPTANNDGPDLPHGTPGPPARPNTTDEDTALSVSAANGVLANDTDPDGVPPDTQTVTKLNNTALSGGVATGTASDGGAVTLHSDGSYTYNPGAIHQGLSTGEFATATFTYTMKDTAGVTSSATVTVTINGISDPPVANPESYDAIGNTGLYVSTTPPSGEAAKTITGSVKTNDTDPDTTAANLTIESTSGQATTLSGGKVSMNSDGTFTYQPPPNQTGVDDTFTYRLCDVPTCNSSTPSNDQSTGTVTIHLAGQVWYVKNDAPASPTPDGTSDNPFKTLAQADTASSTGDTTFVYKGDGTQTGYNTGYTMAANERLLGEVNGLTIDPDGGGPLPTSTLHPGTANAYPNITNLNADVVTLASGAELRGFKIDPQGTGGGIFGGSSVASGTLDNLQVIDTGPVGGPQLAGTQPGLELNGTTGTFNVSSLTVDNSAATGTTSGSEGVLLNNAGTVNFLSAGTISLKTNGAKALDASNGSGTTSFGAGSVFDDITVTGSGSGGVSLNGTTGTVALGGGGVTDLNLTTSSGSAPALSLNNAANVSVPATGTADVSATGGPAVDVTSSVASLPLDAVSSTNSPSNGINLDGLGTGTFSAASGSISGAAGTAFRVANAGSGDITYPGTLNDGTGNTASISGRSGGTVALSGAINDGADAGGGISVTGNTGGTVTISNATKTLNTGASDGLLFNTSDGMTLNLTGGGLNITTTSGKGLEADTSGTLNVTTGSSPNKISTGTSRGLYMNNTDIGSSGVTFHDVSSNGAPEGIRLNNTGSTSSLNVTGDGTSGAQGGDDTGGTIQQSTNTGVYLQNTQSPSFNNLKIDTSGHGGVTGTNGGAAGSTGVRGFSFTNGKILNSGHKSGITPTVNRDQAFDFVDLHGGSVYGDNVDGAMTITNNTLSNNWGGNLAVGNTNGTISNAIFKNNATTNTSSDSTNAAGAVFNLQGNGATVPNLTKADLSNNDIFHPRALGINVIGNSLNSSAPGTWGDPASATNTIKIDNNLIRGGTPDGNTNPLAISSFGIGVSINGFGQGHADVTNNGNSSTPITNVVGNGIGVGVAGSARALFTVSGNWITANSYGGAQGIAVEVDKDGAGNANPRGAFDVNNNHTANTDGPGMWANQHDDNGNMRLSIKNNTFGAPTPHAPDGFEPGLQISTGSAGNASFNPTTCADVSANTIGTGPPDPANPPYHDPGIDLFKRSSSASTYVFGFVGLPNNPATAAQTESYVGATQNPNSAFDNTNSKKALVVAGTNFTPCTLPSPLAPAP